MEGQNTKNEYIEWILKHNVESGTIVQTEEGIRIITDFAKAEINFYEFETLVVELRITQIKNDKTVFFLHFELLDLRYAKELFNEMIETLEEVRKQKSIRILLSCTSAFTTSLMAEKLNQASELASDDFQFEAIPYMELYSKANDYDMVLLAPQIAHEAETIKSILTDVQVVLIPAKLFATYDAPGIFEEIKKEYNKGIEKEKENCSRKSTTIKSERSNVLALAIMNEKENRVRMICRHYREGEAVWEEHIIRRKRNFLHDVSDIIDTTILRLERVDAIGITTPGAIHDGRRLDISSCASWIDPETDIKEYFENRYNIPVVLQNNTQSGVVGFQSQNANYKNLVFYSQGFAARFGGVGTMINGQVIKGAHNIAGEIKYVLNRFYGLNIQETHSVDPEEMLETVEFNVRAIIAFIDPEIIVIRNEMISDIAELQKKLLKSIPKNDLPEIVKISNDEALEYMLLGIMVAGLK